METQVPKEPNYAMLPSDLPAGGEKEITNVHLIEQLKEKQKRIDSLQHEIHFYDDFLRKFKRKEITEENILSINFNLSEENSRYKEQINKMKLVFDQMQQLLKNTISERDSLVTRVSQLEEAIRAKEDTIQQRELRIREQLKEQYSMETKNLQTQIKELTESLNAGNPTDQGMHQMSAINSLNDSINQQKSYYDTQLTTAQETISTLEKQIVDQEQTLQNNTLMINRLQAQNKELQEQTDQLKLSVNNMTAKETPSSTTLQRSLDSLLADYTYLYEQMMAVMQDYNTLVSKFKEMEDLNSTSATNTVSPFNASFINTLVTMQHTQEVMKENVSLHDKLRDLQNHIDTRLSQSIQRTTENSNAEPYIEPDSSRTMQPPAPQDLSNPHGNEPLNGENHIPAESDIPLSSLSTKTREELETMIITFKNDQIRREKEYNDIILSLNNTIQQNQDNIQSLQKDLQSESLSPQWTAILLNTLKNLYKSLYDEIYSILNNQNMLHFNSLQPMSDMPEDILNDPNLFLMTIYRSITSLFNNCLSNTKSALEGNGMNANKSIQDLNDKLQSTENMLNTIQIAKSSLETQLKELKQQLGTHQDEDNQRIHELYEIEDTLKSIFLTIQHIMPSITLPPNLEDSLTHNNTLQDSMLHDSRVTTGIKVSPTNKTLKEELMTLLTFTEDIQKMLKESENEKNILISRDEERVQGLNEIKDILTPIYMSLQSSLHTILQSSQATTTTIAPSTTVNANTSLPNVNPTVLESYASFLSQSSTIPDSFDSMLSTILDSLSALRSNVSQYISGFQSLYTQFIDIKGKMESIQTKYNLLSKEKDASTSHYTNTLETYQHQIEELKETMDTLQSTLQERDTTSNAMKKELERVKQEYAGKESIYTSNIARMNEYDSKFHEIDSKYKQLYEEHKKLQQSIETHEKEINDNRVESTALLNTRESEIQEYLRTIENYKNQLSQLQNDLGKCQSKIQEMSKINYNLNALLHNSEEEKKQMDQDSDEKEDIINQLKKKIYSLQSDVQSRESALQEYQEEKQSMTSRIETLSVAKQEFVDNLVNKKNMYKARAASLEIQLRTCEQDLELLRIELDTRAHKCANLQKTIEIFRSNPYY
ncbi:hypothetical protein WA158_002673 [Blastocystis sp. Blastoise]